MDATGPRERGERRSVTWLRPMAECGHVAIVGAGVGVAAGVTAVVASGVLQSAPTETRFVSGGLKNQ